MDDLFAGVLPFFHTAEELSFRKAAERLGVSTAAVSKAVARLEERLGQKLLIRTTRSVRDLARRHDVEMPITEEVHSMLYEGKNPRISVEDLMTREFKPEFERR